MPNPFLEAMKGGGSKSKQISYEVVNPDQSSDSSGGSWWNQEWLPDFTLPGTLKSGQSKKFADFANRNPKTAFALRAASEIGQGTYDNIIRPMSTPVNVGVALATGGASAGRTAISKLIGPTLAKALPGAIESGMAAISLPQVKDSVTNAYYNPSMENLLQAGMNIGGTMLAPLQMFRNLNRVELPKPKPVNAKPVQEIIPPERQLPAGPPKPVDPRFYVDPEGNVTPDLKTKIPPKVIDAEIVQQPLPESRQLYPAPRVGQFIAGEEGIQQVQPFDRQTRVIPMVEDPGAKPLYHRTRDPNLEFGPVNPASTGSQVAKGSTHFSEEPQTRDTYGPYETIRYTKSGNKFLDISDGEVTPELETAIRSYFKKNGVDDQWIDIKLNDLKNYNKKNIGKVRDWDEHGNEFEADKIPGANFGFEMQEALGGVQNPNVARRLISLKDDAINKADEAHAFDKQAGSDYISQELFGKSTWYLNPDEYDQVMAEYDKRAIALQHNEQYKKAILKQDESNLLYNIVRDTGFRDFLVDQGYDGVRYRGIDNTVDGTNAIGYGITRPQDLSKEIPQFPDMGKPVEATIGGLPEKGMVPFDQRFAQQQVFNDTLGRVVPEVKIKTEGKKGRGKPKKTYEGPIYAEVIDEPTVASGKAETIDPRAGQATGEPTKTTAKTKKGKEIPMDEDLPGNFKTNTNPEDARMDWVGFRAAASVYAQRVAKTFDKYRNLGQQGIDAFEKGAEGFADARKYLDNMFTTAKKAGIDLGFRDNYVSHLFADDPATVQQVFDRFVAEKPGFSKQRFFETYRDAINAGLTPKYNNLTDIIANYSERVYKAVADKKLIHDMKASGVLSDKIKDGYVKLENFPVKGLNGRLTTFYAPADLANKINGYMKDADPTIKTIEAVGGFLKGLVLTGGVPHRAINAHAFSIAARNAMFSENPVVGFKNAAKYMFSPSKAVSYIDDNLAHAERGVQNGLTLGGEKVNFSALGEEIRKAAAIENPQTKTAKAAQLIGKAGEKIRFDRYTNWMQNTFEAPLFDKMLPALKIQKYLEFEEMFIKDGMDPKSAGRAAADMTNKAFGGINWDMKGISRQKQSVARSLLLAPDWLATQGFIAKEMGQALLDPTTPQGKAYMNAARNAMALYLTAQYTNKATSGHWMHENEEGHQFQIELAGMPGVKDGKKFYLTPFNTGMDFARIPFEIANRIAQEYNNPEGNVMMGATDEMKNQVVRRSNPLLTTAGEMFTNTNYRGDPIFSRVDRFGRPQNPFASGSEWIGSKLAPPMVEGGMRFASDKTGPTEAFGEMLELPWRAGYPKPDR